MVWKKREFKDLLLLAAKESYLIFNNILSKQIGGVAMFFWLGPSRANVFLAYHEENWLDGCPLEEHYIISSALIIYLYFKNHLIT